MKKTTLFRDLMIKMLREGELIKLGIEAKKINKRQKSKNYQLKTLFSIFPWKQKKLLMTLIHLKPLEGKKLAISINTPNLRSLVRDTRKSIKKFGLDELLLLSAHRGLEGFQKYFYRLQVKDSNLLIAYFRYISDHENPLLTHR